jgi:N-acetylneuraminate synthase
MKKFIKIGKRKIGEKYFPLIIPELGINHEGNLDLAIHMADLAFKSGAEIIKNQTHIPDMEMAPIAKTIKPGNSNKNIFEIIKKNSLSEKDERAFSKYVNSKKKIFLSTPFSREAVDRLVDIGVSAFKIGSGEMNNLPLVNYICKFKKPIILSTGMNNIKSIKKTVGILNKHKINYALLHTTNIYPTPYKLVRLKCINELREKFKNIPIGLSDHTVDNYVSYAALGLGASIIERHFTDSKNRKGPDISSSMDPKDLKNLICASKKIFEALDGKKSAVVEEKPTINFAFASVVAIKDIKKGEKFSNKNIWVKRPGLGFFKADKYEKILGKVSLESIRNGTLLKRNHVKF